jgi:hypothetical protein
VSANMSYCSIVLIYITIAFHRQRHKNHVKKLSFLNTLCSPERKHIICFLKKTYTRSSVWDRIKNNSKQWLFRSHCSNNSFKTLTVTSTNVAAMQQLRSSAQKCAHYRYLTKLFLHTGHVIFRLSTIVDFFPNVL